jgi:hypothetical protein
MIKKYPIEVTHLFHKLDDKLLELLKSLTEEEWQMQTVAKLWKVKDVAAHLLDGNIRTLSLQRDRYFGDAKDGINSYVDLVNWLNQLNADWVKASKRISSRVMIMLHEFTGKPTSDYYTSVDLDAPAIFAVSWAGEEESKNWFHIAREYTEKWLHQQQIRDAVDKPGILTQEFFTPFLETILYALPLTFREVEASEGTCLQLSVKSGHLDSWFLTRAQSTWVLSRINHAVVHAHLTIEAHAAWKLFSKSWRPNDARPFIEISGDRLLAEKALEMVSFMA